MSAHASARRSKAVWLGLACAAAIGGLIAFIINAEEIFPPPLSPQEQIGKRWLRDAKALAAYTGNEDCRRCHAKEFELHAQSPHAQTVKRILQGEVRPEFQRGDQVIDDQHGVSYTVRTGDGKNWLQAEHAGQKHEAAADWAFGSGAHAWSYLSEGKKGFLEFRISNYKHPEKWDFTPGRGPGDDLPHPLGHSYNALQAGSCFGCHSTVLVGNRKRLDLERSVLNVGCESCHGPGRDHVVSARAYQQAFAKEASAAETDSLRSRIVKFPRSAGMEGIRQCGACHRLPDDALAGDPTLEDQLARFPSVALVRSRCFLESDGKLTCVSCHDPHSKVEKRPIAYDEKCLSCHQPPAGRKCKAGKTQLCVSCHMPKQKIGRKLPLQFHNHWIRSRIPDEALLRRMMGGE